jgi:hypothetical protein
MVTTILSLSVLNSTGSPEVEYSQGLINLFMAITTLSPFRPDRASLWAARNSRSSISLSMVSIFLDVFVLGDTSIPEVQWISGSLPFICNIM